MAGHLPGAGNGFLILLVLFVCMEVGASPGDVLVKSDFRANAWSVYAPKGTGECPGFYYSQARHLMYVQLRSFLQAFVPSFPAIVCG